MDVDANSPPVVFCSKCANMTLTRHIISQYTLSYPYRTHMFACPKCGDPFIYLTNIHGTVIKQLYPQSLHRPLSQSVPNDVQEIFREAEDVMGTSPRCVPLICRSLLQQILRPLTDKQDNLYSQIEEYLSSAGMDKEELAVFMAYIRLSGNDMAHLNGDAVFTPTLENCERILSAMEDIFYSLYEKPARAKALKESNGKIKDAIEKR